MQQRVSVAPILNAIEETLGALQELPPLAADIDRQRAIRVLEGVREVVLALCSGPGTELVNLTVEQD